MKFLNLLLLISILAVSANTSAQKKSYKSGSHAISGRSTLPGQKKNNLMSRAGSGEKTRYINPLSIPGRTEIAAQGELLEKLDSIVYNYWDGESQWMVQDKEEYTYDVRGNMLSYKDYIFDWFFYKLLPDELDELSYDNMDRVTAETNSRWDTAAADFIPQNRSSYQYDGGGNLTGQLDEYWNLQTGGWSQSSRYTNNYNDIDQQTEHIYESFNGETWDPQQRELTIYDGNDREIIKNNYYWNWDSSNWELNYYDSTLYAADGLSDTTFSSYWDGFQFYPERKTIREHDAAGRETLMTDYYYNGEMQWWEQSFRVQSSYDGAGRIIDHIYTEGDSIKGFNWSTFRETYAYDSKGNYLSYYSTRWDTAQADWVPDERETYIYDHSSLQRNIALPSWWYSGDAEGLAGNTSKLVRVKSQENYNVDTFWVDYSDITLYYSDMYGGVSEDICKADFTWEKDPSDVQQVLFTDASAQETTSWYWTFGDGETSTMQNPKHKYAVAESYKVSLTTINETGLCNSTITKLVKAGGLSCNADFKPTVDTANLGVRLLNWSEGVNPAFTWDFGDGSRSSVKDPVHQYTVPGSYTISVTVQNSDRSCMDEYSTRVQVGQAECDAGFSVFVDSSSNTAYFKTKEANKENKYYWVFGDGTISNARNPIHEFARPGYYSAALTVSNNTAGCTDSYKELLLVGGRGANLQADFIYQTEDGKTVNFSDRSQGSDLTYYWNFGDGNWTKEANPDHVYLISGYHNVCLTVYSSGGKQSTSCQKIYAGTETAEDCLAKFIYQVVDSTLTANCLDQSYGKPDKWMWSYPDGWTSNEPNPIYTLAAPGFYTIQLTINNSESGCSDDAFEVLNVAAESRLKAGIGYTIHEDGKKADSYPVDYVGVTLGDAGKLKWDFGDGESDSTTSTPTHQYAEPGTYEVCYTITNTVTGEEDTQCETVVVEEVTAVQTFPTNQTLMQAYPNPVKEAGTVSINLTSASSIDLSVYDMMGRKILEIDQSQRTAGKHLIEFNASGIETGSYYLLLRTGNGETGSQIINILR